MNIEQETVRRVSRALSRPIFAQLAKGQSPSDLFSFIPKNLKFYRGRPIKVARLLETIYNFLSESYRNEYFYKTAIINKVAFGRHSPRTLSVQIEMPVGRSFVDLAMFNGTSTAYEIKTEYDSPRRLFTQTKDYLTAFEFVYIVTSEQSANNYLNLCNEKVGVLCLNQRGNLSVVRQATSNKEEIEPRTLFRMLRKSEYLPAIESITGEHITLPNGLIPDYCERIYSELDGDVAQTAFLKAVRQRTTNEAQVAFVRALPPYLRTLGYATPLSNLQRETLIEGLELPATAQ